MIGDAVRVRPYEDADLLAIHAINGQSTPGVSAETAAALASYIGVGTGLVSEDGDGSVLGFITLLETGAVGYPSLNLKWFEERGGNFVYVDRIACRADARGRGVGERLYLAAFEEFADRRTTITCEVNSAPPNPGSMRFHRRLGFVEVGTQVFGPDKAVAYLSRPLAPG